VWIIWPGVRTGAALTLIVIALAGCGGDGGDGSDDEDGPPRFSDPRRIDNRYSPLTKFDRCELRGEEDGTRIRVVRRKLDTTEPFRIGNQTVEAAVVEDRDFEDGELVERTLDYFAQADDGTVHYFGEDVDDYEGGKVVGHKGAWRYGRDTRTLGVLMPGDPQLGERWRFEDVPGVTKESNRVVRRLDSVRVRGTRYRDVISVRESIQPEGDIEHKLYAHGTGVVRELPPAGRLELVECR
jgi:hypothetical protein